VSRLFPQTPDWRLNRREASLSEIVQRFERIRRDTPDRPLVHHPATGATFTAENLWNAAAQYRRQLAALGLDGEHLIVLIAGNRPAAVSLWLACRQLEVAVMPVDVGTTAAEIRALADRFGASVAILPVTFGGIEELGEICRFSTDLLAIRLAGITPRPQIYRGAAALKVTSGSTGLPKATFTREAQLVADTEHITTAMGIRPGDRQMAIIPLSHAYGLGNLLMPVLLQGTAIVLREAFVPQQFLADARTWDARVFHGVPFMFAHFVSSAEGLSWPSGLSRLISAGARQQDLPGRLASRFTPSTGRRRPAASPSTTLRTWQESPLSVERCPASRSRFGPRTAHPSTADACTLQARRSRQGMRD
jgi:long-chain acyl-CoA synthetase